MNLEDKLSRELSRRGLFTVTPQMIADSLRALDMTLVEGQRAAASDHLNRHLELSRKIA